MHVQCCSFMFIVMLMLAKMKSSVALEIAMLVVPVDVQCKSTDLVCLLNSLSTESNTW